MLAGRVLAQPFFQLFNQQVALALDFVLDVENLLALGALDFFEVADFVLQGVLFVNGGGNPNALLTNDPCRVGGGIIILHLRIALAGAESTSRI